MSMHETSQNKNNERRDTVNTAVSESATNVRIIEGLR